MRAEHQTRRVVLIGPPGAGKGTQANAIASYLEVPHVSTGDTFRRNIREGSELGLAAKAYMDCGELVPDGLTMAMVSGRLAEEDTVGGFLLDGFPRNLHQARSLDETLRRSGHAVDLVLELNAPVEEVVRRLNGRRTCGQCGRSWHVEFSPTRVEGICDVCAGWLHRRDDDHEDSIRRRLELYEQQTSPLLRYYQENDVLARVDALGPFEVVGERILAVFTADGAGPVGATPPQD
ncbi:adenylate kinase [Parasphingorhabdus pacifica]